MEKWTRIVHTPRLGRRLMALLLCLSMLSSYLPVFALAEESQPGLCEHHPAHDATCGYQEAVEGQDCTHDHGEECYTYQTACLHQHTESCYTTAEPSEEGQAVEPVLNCTHVCSSAPICLHQHGDECYTEDVLTCTHDCSTDVGCVTRVLNCQHQHDATCGYVAAVPAQSCTYHCDSCCPHDDKPASCVCESKCTESSCNQECPVCKDDWDSCEFEEAEVTTSGCICSKTCTEAEKNAECPVCADAPDACEYVEPVCVCQSKCTEDNKNSECPVCADAPDACEYVEPVCNCQSKCTEELYNNECPVCADAPDACNYVEPVCNCQSKCTEELYNSECPVCAAAHDKCSYVEQPQADLVVTGWKWIFEEEVLEADILNELPLDASQEMPAYFDDVLELLPFEISATLEGQTEPTPLALTWVCPDYPETGAYEGEYTFTAALPTGFSLAEGVEAPSILVTFGGASNLNQTDVAEVSYYYVDDNGYTTTEKFPSISDAFKMANNISNNPGIDCTLKLLNSRTLNDNLTVTGRFNLDFNGNELTFNGGSLIIESGGLLILEDTSNSSSTYGVRGTSNTNVIVKSGGYLGVSSGARIFNEGGTNGCCVKIDGGSVDVSGGYFKNNGSGCIIDNSTGNLTVNGGKFYPSNDANTFNKLTEGMLKGGTFGKLTVVDKTSPVDLRAALGENRAYFSDSSATTLMKVEAGQKSIDSPVTVGEHDSHTFTYTINENQHTAICGCGYTVEEAHTFPTEGATNTCTKCNGFKVSYLDKDGKEKETVAQKLESGSDVTLSPGWYVVTGNVEIENRIEITDTLNLILADGSTLNATKGGIHVPEGKTLTIYAQSEENAKGKLVAQGSTNQAGIGGNQNEKGGTITIHGGHIEATGGYSGAGIGGGDIRNGGNITISGGKITANGGVFAAGIGGGNSGSGGVINISGGHITATGNNGGAGIGGGNGGNGDVIKISGGHITATGNNGGAGIGGGARLHPYTGSGGTVTISGGHITATGYNGGAGIGSGNGGSGGTITIKSGTVTAQSSCGAYSTAPNTAEYSNFKLSVGEKLDSPTAKTYAERTAEGSGALYTTNKAVVIQPCEETGTAVYQDANNHQVTCEYCNFQRESTKHVFDEYGLCICGAAKYLDENGTEKETVARKLQSGSDVTLSPGWYVVSPDENSDTVEISDRLEIQGSVNLILPDGSTLNANQGIHVPSDAILSIYGQSGQSGQLNAYCSIIDTTDDRVRYAAIGGNDSERYGLLNFNGGKVTAQVGADGKDVTSAAIGGGYNAAFGGTININRGEVTATVIGSESTGAAIGGGNNGIAGNITINGGTVCAAINSVNSAGAAIGNGISASLGLISVITVNDGLVTAVINGSSEGAAIGGGYADAGAGNVDINLNGGTVNATVNGISEGAAIGGGKNAKVGNIVIDGAIVTATVAAGENQTADVAAIGCGRDGTSSVTITIKSGTVTAQSSYRAYSTAPNTESYSNFKLSVGESLEKLTEKTYAQRTEHDSDVLYTNNRAVKIQPCDIIHDTLTPVYLDKQYHQVTCEYCNFQRESTKHDFDEYGLCICGAAKYLDADGTEQNVKTTILDKNTETLTLENNIWYSVKGTVTVTNRIEVEGAVNLILPDGSTLNANKGIHVPEGKTLTIYAQSQGDQMGKLVANGSEYEAGIGGNKEQTGGTITIHGGTIEATGGREGAGIGGGLKGAGGSIIIYGGKIKAKGKTGGAGIGGGNGGKGGTITIHGGTIEASGGYEGAGIGGGRAGDGGTINIHGGTIEATGGSEGAGIGGGHHLSTSGSGGDGGTINIHGGTIEATGGSLAAGIGGGFYGDGGTINIHGGTIKATGGSYAAGIGGGKGGDGGTVTISGGTIKATGTDGGAGIGGGGDGGTTGSFSTDETGTAVIFASSIQDKTNVESWKGTIFQSSEGKVYGNQTLTASVTLPSGYSLLVPEGVTLTAGNYLTNNGTIYVDGTLTGTINGSVYYRLTLEKATIDNTAATVSYDDKTYVQANTKITLKLEDGKMVKSWEYAPEIGGFTIDNNNQFIMPAQALTIKAQVVDIAATVSCGGTVTNHSSIDAAFIAANGKEGSTVKLMKDAENAEGVSALLNVSNSFTLDLNGKTLSRDITVASGSLTIQGGATSGTMAGKLTVAGGSLMIQGGSFSQKAITCDGGTLQISGGTFPNGIELEGNLTLLQALADGVAFYKRTATGETSTDEIQSLTSSQTSLIPEEGASIVVKEHACKPTYSEINQQSHNFHCGDCGRSGEDVPHSFIVDGNPTVGTCPCGAAYIQYQAYVNGSMQQQNAQFCAPVTQNMTDGWYVVSQNVEFEKRLNVNGDVHLILMDNTTLTAKEGIHVSENNSLSIYAQSDGDGMGALAAAYSGSVAAIGGDVNETGGTITIHGGKITANGGSGAAGIGGGYGGAGGSITIYGGDITANGGNTAAGIGGGENGAGGNITIYGGKITASCGYYGEGYGSYGAGIGGGYKGAGGSITIHGGDITATGGYEAAGIGGGAGCKSGDTVVSPSGGTINISGGNIEANGGQSGAGIGGGRYGAGGTINISGGKITADGGNWAAGIGGGDQGAGGNISISGNAEVTATSSGYGAGIGGGNKGAGVSITISGGTIKATGNGGGAGIGGGAGYGNNKPSAGTIDISGGTITATGNDGGAGIGGGSGGSGGEITISGGDIEATGGDDGAGIGGGDQGAGVEIAISGGKITATGGKWAAGIGGGCDSSYGVGVSNVNISISGNAEVTATGGRYGAGIGGGCFGDGGSITIHGGTITATGGFEAAGIGSGYGYDGKVTSGGNIQISGGTVEARGGGNAAGIGGGYYGNGGNVTISGNANVTATSGFADGSQDKIPAGIGSGAYPINDSSVTITGGTVTINRSTVTALSTGDGTAFSVNPTLGTAVKWKVSTGESAEKLTPVTFAARTDDEYSGYTTSKAAKIEPCTEHSYAPVYVNADSHKICCVWCDVLKQESEPHDFNNSNSVCSCGAAYIQYQAYVDGSMQQQNAQFCAPVTQNMTAGWYVVSRDMEFDTRLTVNGEVHLILMDNKTLTAKEGIEVTAGNSLSIYAQSQGEGMGALNAQGSSSQAGIGSSYDDATETEYDCGTITIHGGNVTANGGWFAAGIGGGSGGDGGTITIYGGDIEARGGAYYGAGIGGGHGGDGGTITIHGGNVIAYGGRDAAGIGGGSGGDGGSITISGGVIDANGGDDSAGDGGGAGIGGGYEGEGGTITISGGTVYAGGGDENGAGIGGGYKGAGGNITITGGDIEAYGGDDGAGIGSGAGDDDEVIKPSGGTITISGGTVYAKGYSNGAGIGGGELCAGGTITISGGDIEAESEGDGAGIGGGDKGAGGTINISGGYIVAKCEGDGAGVGGGYKGTAGSFSTGENGKAVIFASSIQDQSGAGSWKGTIFQGSEGKVCGDQILTADVTLPSGYSLLVPEGVTLNAGDYLTNYGEIYVDGILNGNVTGSIYYLITAEGITVSGAETFGEKIYALKDSTITLTPPGPDGDYVFKQWLIENEPVANNQFRMPAKPVTIIVNWEPAVSIDSYTSSCVTSYDQSAKLSVTIRKAPAATADVTYQWYLNDKPISGAVQSSYTTPSDLNAGEYTYECTITCGSASVSQKIPVTVKKIGRGITFSAPNKTYDGQKVTMADKISYPGDGAVTIQFKTQGAADSTYTTAAPVSAGSYTVRVSVAEGTNHKAASAVRDFTIGKKPVTVTITPNGGTYGGTITPASAVLTGAAAGEKVEVTLTYNGSTQVPSKAGSYTVTASISDGNYQLTGTTAAEFVIQKATVKTPTVASKDYSGSKQTADIQDTDLYTVTKNQGGVEIGSYEVVLSLKDPSNYQWDENGGKTTFQIIKAGSNTWTTQPDIGGWTYGDAPSTPTAAARYGTVKVDYTADGKTYTEAVPTQAGTYKARFTVAETDRYSGLEMHKSFTINSRPVTVTITPNGGTYGGTITPASAVLTGAAAGEKVEVKLTYNGSTQVPTKAGSYTVTASISDGNYQLTGTTAAQFVIQKATVKTPAVASKDYNGKNQTADIQDTDLYTVTKNEGGVEIGSYEVVLTLKDPSNYQWDENGGKLTFEIVKAGSNTWTTQPDIGGWTYGDAPSTPTAAARYGTVLVDYTADGKTYSEAVPTQAGTYKARFTVAETGDHNGLEMEKEFTIAKRPVTVSGIKAESKTYDAGTAAKLNLTEAVLNGKLASDDLTFTASGTFKDARAGQGKTVTISVTLGGKSAANYVLTGSLTAKADIARRELTLLRVRIADKQYDGLNTASFYMPPVLSGVCGNDQVILVNGVPTFETVEVGTGIKVNVTPFDLHGPDSMNYTLIQPTGLTGNIVNNYHPEAGLDYTTTGGQWSNQNFVITAKEGNTLSTGNTADGTWKNELTVSQEGEGELTFYVRDDSTGAISNPVTVSYMVDKTAPTGSILFDGADVTDRGDGRAIYKNADVKVTITGSDALSGVAELAYYQSNAVLNHAQVEAVTEWTPGNGFTLKAENGASCVVYAKVTDKAGNVAYFRSFQLLFDTDAPGLSGIVDGATYYTTQIVHVDDEALQSLTLNGENVTSPVTLPGNTDGTYTITATDKAGNSTTCTVTMKKISSLYEQVADINSENVGKSDKTSLEAAKSALEALPVSPVEAENREIQDALSNINAALKALENAAEVQRQIDSLPDTAKPGDTAAKEEVNRVRENYDKLTEHEKSLVETKKLEELEDALGFHRIVEGAGSVWFKGSGLKLTFKANGSMEGFTGVKLDGKLITAFTTDPGSNAVALEPALLQGLTLGEHKLRFVYADGETRDAVFTVKVSPNYLDLEGKDEFNGQTEVWVDGVAYPVETLGGRYVNLPDSGSLLTIYTYQQGNSNGSHDNYPTGMKVYRIERTQNGATVEHLAALDDLLQYSGCSIRVNGKQGIRMITSLTQQNKDALTSTGLAGFTLEEYGTVVSWVKELGNASLTLDNGRHNYAYKKDVADPIFAASGGLTQYTNVLVGFNLEQCKDDIVMRPYIVLKDADGQLVMLYGGTVTRSIGYIACQNRNTFQPGSAAYQYVWEIIHSAYGDQFDSEYQG